MTAFADQHSLFRAYDIRGAQHYFNPEFVQALGNAFANLYTAQSCEIKAKQLHENIVKNDNKTFDKTYAQHSTSAQHPKIQPNTIIIGYDVRCHSDTIAHTLTQVLHRHGLTVIHLGLVTTPMMAFWAQRYGGHGIMVTASHSKKGILGVKWLIGNASPSSADIQNLYQSLLSIEVGEKACTENNIKTATHFSHNNPQNCITTSVNISTSRIINLPATMVADTYIKAITGVLTHIHHPVMTPIAGDTTALSKLDVTVVIDCLHGATSNVAQSLFERFCRQVIMINDVPDGSFPTGNPDPTEPNRLAELQQTVIVHEADMGLAFDGDGDRLMIVDNRGKVVAPDHLLYLLAQVAITERPSTIESAQPQVLFDVKCSHHLIKLLTTLGATPVMTRTGSSLLRQQLTREPHAIFAGELSGHFIFNDGYFMAYDDAMYGGLRLLHWLTHTASISPERIKTENIKKPANFVTDTQQNISNTTMTIGVWGELKPVSSSYQLTDITQHLPLMVSTADHYLPLPSQTSRCSIIEQLIEFCHRLQQLIDQDTHSTASIPLITHHKTAASMASSSYECTYTGPLPTTAQAHQLLPAGTRLSCTDGLRLDFEHGFGVLRKSNTSDSLTVRFAGDSVADLRDIQARFVALCRPFHDTLAEQIAAIYSE